MLSMSQEVQSDRAGTAPEGKSKMNRRNLTLFALVAVTIPSLGCIAKPEFTGRVTVLTYDADDPEYLTPEIASLIREADADVVCVQEARIEWCREFKRQFKDQYRARLFDDRFLSFHFTKHLAIFSKYSLRSIKSYPPLDDDSSAVCWIVEAETPAGPVQIANVRLMGQQAEMDATLAAMKPQSPSIITGEFSGDRKDSAIQRAERSGFTDVLPRLDAKTPTWKVRQLIIVARAQRDHILCSSHFEPVAARVLSTRKSDHSPVWAELKLVEKATTMPDGKP